MNSLTQAIYSLLKGDATLAGLIAGYQGAPAILTADPVPLDVPRPYVVTAQPLHDEAFDAKNTTIGRTVRQDVRIVSDATGSSQLLDSIAERVRVLLHRQTLSVAGYSNIVTDASGPVHALSDPRVMMLVVTIRFILV